MKKYNTVKNQELTETTRNRLNTVYLLLKQSTTKEEIIDTLDINERVARDLISFVKKKFPVISISSSKGYRLAQSYDDLADAKQTVDEVQSRIKDLNKGIAPLINFISQMEVQSEEK